MIQGQPISDAVFRRLVRTLSCDQLRKLPLERLPASIPVDLVDADFEPDKYAVLNDLAWSVGARELSRRSEASDQLGTAERQALETLEAAHTRSVPEFARLTQRIADEWHGGGAQTADSGDTATLECARVMAAEMTEVVGALHRAIALLDRPLRASEDLCDRVSDARMQARPILKTMEAALGRYELLEMDIAQNAMRARQRQCDDELHRYRELDEQIRSVEDKLRSTSQQVRRLIAPRVARRQQEYLMERLDRLQRQRESAETFVSEQDLLQWLQVLVNASLHVPRDQWRQRAQRTRLLLYRLMNIYCLQQESAAQQVAMRAMPGVNGREAIGYYLKSERFILSYFARKRQQVTLWLSGAADEKLGRLDQVRDAILSDYRRYASRPRSGGTRAAA